MEEQVLKVSFLAALITSIMCGRGPASTPTYLNIAQFYNNQGALWTLQSQTTTGQQGVACLVYSIEDASQVSFNFKQIFYVNGERTEWNMQGKFLESPARRRSNIYDILKVTPPAGQYPFSEYLVYKNSEMDCGVFFIWNSVGHAGKAQRK
nr:uncharacterized protein LOC129385436 isoform X2 [Dermacentor andersoni]